MFSSYLIVDGLSYRRDGGKAKWYLGRIERVYKDGTYDLVYDDGDRESRVQESLIRASSEKAREKERTQVGRDPFFLLGLR